MSRSTPYGSSPAEAVDLKHPILLFQVRGWLALAALYLPRVVVVVEFCAIELYGPGDEHGLLESRLGVAASLSVSHQRGNPGRVIIRLNHYVGFHPVTG